MPSSLNPFQPMNKTVTASDPIRIRQSAGVIGADAALTYLLVQAIAKRQAQEPRMSLWQKACRWLHR
jgi:hypothetical protein